MSADRSSAEYLQNLPRATASLPVLRTLALELRQQVPIEQLRALLYLTGRRIAAERPVNDLKTLAEFEQFARLQLAELDLGWLKLEETASGVDFLHGAAPLSGWFGGDSSAWAPALLEGVYAEWMRQLGAGDQLDVREVAQLPGEPLRFRMAHASSFGE